MIQVITFCSSKNYNMWEGLRVTISTPIILAIMFLSFQNSRITSDRFMEEGKSAARAVVVLFVFVLIVIIWGAVTEPDPEMFVTLFWLNTIKQLVLPDLLLTVLYVPKVST